MLPFLQFWLTWVVFCGALLLVAMACMVDAHLTLNKAEREIEAVARIIGEEPHEFLDKAKKRAA